MSVSKSITSSLCGIYAARGLLAPDDLVVDHVHELRDTSWQGCTIQHLLDMRTGTRWNYADDEINIFHVSDYCTSDRRDLPADTESWIRSIDKAHEHGGPFRYVSLASEMYRKAPPCGWLASMDRIQLAVSGGRSVRSDVR